MCWGDFESVKMCRLLNINTYVDILVVKTVWPLFWRSEHFWPLFFKAPSGTFCGQNIFDRPPAAMQCIPERLNQLLDSKTSSEAGCDTRHQTRVLLWKRDLLSTIKKRKSINRRKISTPGNCCHLKLNLNDVIFTFQRVCCFQRIQSIVVMDKRHIEDLAASLVREYLSRKVSCCACQPKIKVNKLIDFIIFREKNLLCLKLKYTKNLIKND